MRFKSKLGPYLVNGYLSFLLKMVSGKPSLKENMLVRRRCPRLFGNQVTRTSRQGSWLWRIFSSAMDLSRSTMDHRYVFWKISGLEMPLFENSILLCCTPQKWYHCHGNGNLTSRYVVYARFNWSPAYCLECLTATFGSDTISVGARRVSVESTCQWDLLCRFLTQSNYPI
jgi:hypothetical protein